MAERLIVFVCTGNICRSPMAEYLLRDCLDSISGWEVSSAGLAASYGLPASQTAVDVLAERNIDMTLHRSRPVEREWIDAPSLIVVMTRSQQVQLRALFPDTKEKLFLLRSFDSNRNGEDVEDPIGSSLKTYREVREHIEAALPDLMTFMNRLE